MPPDSPLLLGRHGSHFTRLVRIVAAEAGVDLAFQSVPDLRSLDPAAYGGNPGLKLPTLIIGEERIFGAITICRRIVGRSHAAFDPIWPEAMSPAMQNAWELLSQAMLTQVQLVFGVTISGLPLDHPFFIKAARGLDGTLAWLDERLPGLLAEPSSSASLFEAALFCQLDHLRFRPTAELAERPALERFRQAFGARPSALATPYGPDGAAAKDASR